VDSVLNEQRKETGRYRYLQIHFKIGGACMIYSNLGKGRNRSERSVSSAWGGEMSAIKK